MAASCVWRLRTFFSVSCLFTARLDKLAYSAGRRLLREASELEVFEADLLGSLNDSNRRISFEFSLSTNNP
jgi:hypothetical protein